ncbi:c-type cytochrome [Prosthecobacter algae]|uniref:C-type cytochrome n=1 Tax=Prosthecobacter algae TaxID=1144682 RepID=A0ABP9PHD4_9BACT
MLRLSLSCLLLLQSTLWAVEAPKMPVVPAEVLPQIEVLQPGVKLTLLAEHPELVTPTGIDVDAKGQIWLIACHTHFRPEGYTGPAHDEILTFDAQGKNRRVFYNKTQATMNLQLGRDGWVYLAERSRILRVKDTNADGVGDLEENLATLDTVSDYPHNGLSGMAWHPDGGLVFALGENFGKDWTLTARDGSKVSGRGEGGIFRCTPEGKKMRRIARGFWNPFGLLVRKDGEIFAAENDPGSRPPCRLLNIVEGADYGFQWVYGSAPVHPFVAWNGELRGTLGMVHPCGEGPCAVKELGGGVLIPSWSNHCVDYFPLTRQGAGYTSQRIELLRGSDFFRPVCMAQGPDGSFYMTDWVFSSYPIHARGRLWKLEIDATKASWLKPSAEAPNAAAQLAQGLRSGQVKLSVTQLLSHARGKDAYLSDAALTALARENWTPETFQALPAADRVWALVALRRTDLVEEKWVRSLLGDPDPEIRFECLRWIADAVLISFAADVEKMLADPTLDYRLFEAALATWNTLRGEPGAGVTNPEVLVGRILDTATPAKIKGYALRLAPVADKRITIALLRDLLGQKDDQLSLEVVRSLAAKNADDARAILAELARDENQPAALRTEAIQGLSTSSLPAHQSLLVALSSHPASPLAQEAQRALRFTPEDKTFALNPQRPIFENTAAWLRLLDSLPGKADAENGRRLFFHPKVALCANCHRHSGRGNVVGPDLSLVFQQGDRSALLRSILEPHREVAPQFYPTQLKLADGTDFIGILLRSSSTEVYRDLTGKERTFQKADIVSRTELKTSLMPAGLVASLTDAELRDLLAFLTKSSTEAGTTP